MQEWGPRSPKRAKLEKKYGRGDLLVSLGWEAYNGPGRQPQPKAAAYFLGRNGRLLDSMDVPVNVVGDLNWHTKHMSRSVYYIGQKTGSPGYTEQIWVDLSRIPSDCDKVVFVAYIDRGVERQISWGMFKNAYARMSDAGTADQEFLRMKLSDVHKDDMTVILAAVQRRGDVWDLTASGAGTAAAEDLLTTIRSFVEDAYRTDSQRPHPDEIDESLMPPPPETPPVEEQIAWYDAFLDELEKAAGREKARISPEYKAIHDGSEYEMLPDGREYEIIQNTAEYRVVPDGEEHEAISDEAELGSTEWIDFGAVPDGSELETERGPEHETVSDSLEFDAPQEWAEADAVRNERALETEHAPQMDAVLDELSFETNAGWSEFAQVSEWTESDADLMRPESETPAGGDLRIAADGPTPGAVPAGIRPSENPDEAETRDPS